MFGIKNIIFGKIVRFIIYTFLSKNVGFKKTNKLFSELYKNDPYVSFFPDL